jgi:hypothetical protein
MIFLLPFPKGGVTGMYLGHDYKKGIPSIKLQDDRAEIFPVDNANFLTFSIISRSLAVILLLE